MALYGPDGQPVGAKAPTVEQQLIQIAGIHRDKIEALNITMLQHGFFLEFVLGLVNDVLRKLGQDSGQDFEIKLDGFEAFAQARYREMQTMALQAQAEAEKSQLKNQPDVLVDLADGE